MSLVITIGVAITYYAIEFEVTTNEYLLFLNLCTVPLQYIQKDSSKAANRKDKSTYFTVLKKDDQPGSSTANKQSESEASMSLLPIFINTVSKLSLLQMNCFLLVMQSSIVSLHDLLCF